MTLTIRADREKFDSRGLPTGFDPESLFRYRYDTLVKSATGLESFAYKVIPFEFIRSWAFALDPTYRFKISPSTITAVTRTQRRRTLSVTDLRKGVRTRQYRFWSQDSNYRGIAFCSSPDLKFGGWTSTEWERNLTPRPPSNDVLRDTTSRTRIIGSTQGELELFKSTSNSPVRTSTFSEAYRRWSTPPPYDVDPACKAVGGAHSYEIGSDDLYTTTFGPTAAVLSESTLLELQVGEIARCKSLCADNATSMLKGASLFTRSYSLSRNFAELKDLPRSIAQAQQTIGDLKTVWSSLMGSPKTRDQIFDLSNKAASNLPGEYLSYHFGWKQLYKDLSDLTALPERLSKKFNFLLKRAGKPTTYRSKRDILEGGTRASGFVYDHTDGDKEWFTSHSHRISRQSEVRLVINATFDFPPVNVPSFRNRFFYDQVGLIPRFIDVYNIIPWTWLIDWGTGLGNYLELIEEINNDPSLVNWGLITCKTTGKLTTEFEWTNADVETYYQDNTRISPEPYGNYHNKVRHHTSVLDFECQTRMNVSRVYDVERTTEPNTLTGYRSSILAALLAQRVDNSRAGTFRPRS